MDTDSICVRHDRVLRSIDKCDIINEYFSDNNVKPTIKLI